MKHVCASILLLLSVLMMSSCSHSHSQNEFSVMEGPYLGQIPPGSTPEIFAPGIVNTKASSAHEGMFAPGMKAFYFVRTGGTYKTPRLVVIEYKNNQWQESIVKPGESEPSISPDGMTLYLQNKYMERTSAGWSELKTLGAPFKDILIMRISVASNETYYFDTYSRELDTPLRYSRLIDGKYEQPKSLGPQFAIGTYNAHPFVAPDDSYIIWDSVRENGFGSSDLYISFRAADGSWGPAINMGDKINTASAENYPSVSPDGKFLFFDRRVKPRNNTELDMYWVDAQIIENLRPEP